jgi:hypothetical protein
VSDKGPYRKLKYFLFTMIALVVLACIAPFFLKGPGDRALITPDHIKLPDVKLPGQKSIDPRPIAKNPDLSGKKNQVVLYRWQDKNGTWHFTDYPNPEGPSQEIRVTPDRQKNNDPSSSPKTIDEPPVNVDELLGGDIHFLPKPSDVKKLKEEAAELRDQLEKRYEELDQMAKDRSGR